MTDNQAPQAVVAGHICLDIIPEMSNLSGTLDTLLVPGKLLNIGKALLSTGGVVSNTGLALHKLGLPVKLLGKVGDDEFGRAVQGLLNRRDPSLSQGMIVSEQEGTSYTLVINPPGVDRIFLHHPGCNDTFCADDIDFAQVGPARLFHFGYPPLMRQIYSNNGQQLETILQRAREHGMTTSLDMAFVDPASPAGQIDWRQLLTRCLPCLDIFLPSMDEILYMLDRDRFEKMQQAARDGDIASQITTDLLDELSTQLLDMGAAVVAMKLGDQGLYLRTTSDASRLQNAGACFSKNVSDWLGRQLITPCFQVDVVGTTGSGDCTIAGFLAGVIKGLSPVDAVTAAVATGACNVEAADAISGVRSWQDMQERIASGWPRRTVRFDLPYFQAIDSKGLFAGPADQSRSA